MWNDIDDLKKKINKCNSALGFKALSNKNIIEL